MSRKIVMTLVCILVLGLSGCGDTLTLNQYNTSEIWYIAYTDIDTVCESNELTADGSSIEIVPVILPKILDRLFIHALFTQDLLFLCFPLVPSIFFFCFVISHLSFPPI